MRCILLLLVFVSCQLSDSKLTVLADAPLVSLSNGVTYYDGKVFTGELVFYARDSILMYSCFYEKGRKQGEEKKWYANGQLENLRFYTNGKKTGIHKGWWSSGLPKFLLMFNAKGAYHGLVQEWFEDGTVSKLFHYENGKEEGSQQMFKVNGAIRANYVVKHGERYGLIGLKKCEAIQTN